LCDIKTNFKLNPGLMIVLIEICKMNKLTLELVAIVQKYITTTM
jgi:hypothetical protein